MLSLYNAKRDLLHRLKVNCIVEVPDFWPFGTRTKKEHVTEGDSCRDVRVFSPLDDLNIGLGKDYGKVAAAFYVVHLKNPCS